MRNTHAPNAWTRLFARWSQPSPTESPVDGALPYESLDGGRAFWLKPFDGRTDDTTADWILFRHSHGYPPSAPAAPDAPFLLVVHAVAHDDEDREAFRRWLAEEHGRRQTTLPGVRWLHAYEQEGADHSFLNLWGVDDPAVVDSEAWRQIRRSPWWDQVAHVAATADRGVFRRRGSPTPD